MAALAIVLLAFFVVSPAGVNAQFDGCGGYICKYWCVGGQCYGPQCSGGSTHTCEFCFDDPGVWCEGYNCLDCEL
jgi:hypothetical protein